MKKTFSINAMKHRFQRNSSIGGLFLYKSDNEYSKYVEKYLENGEEAALIFYKNSEFWTLLTSHRLIGLVDGIFREVSIQSYLNNFALYTIDHKHINDKKNIDAVEYVSLANSLFYVDSRVVFAFINTISHAIKS
jgi:hypothetical protein